MEKEGAKFYNNMTRSIIDIFLKYSEEYQNKRIRNKTVGQVIKPIESNKYLSRMQIDLADVQSLPDDEYKWILNAQDHFTKYCHLRPLNVKSAV